MTGFPVTNKHSPRAEWEVLFRHDGDSTLVQSLIAPDYSRVIAPEQIQQKEYTPTLIEGNQYRFRLAINAIARQSRTGRDLNCDPMVWLSQRDFGVTFDDMSAIHDPLIEKSRGQTIRVNRYNVDGILTVTDAERLATAISSGIGRGRAWGCGLMSLVQVG